MNKHSPFLVPVARSLGAATVLVCAAAGASAHVTLARQTASAGSDFDAAFRVGHACKGAAATTGVTVRVPEGFTVLAPQPRAGWSVNTNGNEVSWKADSADKAVPSSEKTQFVLRGRVGAKPGTLWFKVLQTCDAGSANWAMVPASDADKPEFPAARLDVVTGAVAPVEVSGAWVRRAVPGQSGTGAFMTLKSDSTLRLVGASTPLAGVAEVHEMKMEGDTMKMRQLDKGLELPAGQSVELKPGGYHLMLMDLKQEIAAGSSVPLQLKFEDAQGKSSVLSLHLTAALAPAGQAHAHGDQAGAMSGMADDKAHQHPHKH
ncbi:copper chaperone PCu(A)C [Variovorax dokdonensis]|uniref:Copper chaperone PCu(A)C n=1 Tax=Variovorax dokdonensis TaxID=344883 RepID=A0ABT7NGC5_9BURK|nr:copper chaperone PCu(A)C [Variovorax dokdonensis]MDM0046983.1 copper chaperone PCu(A)C [Variovorax dokdonensis]